MWLYFLIVRLAALWNKKAKKLVKGQAETFGQMAEVDFRSERWVWFHAASVGEAEQARAVIEPLKAEWKKRGEQRKILMTFFSPSGYEMWKGREAEKGVDKVMYLPFATRRNAHRFLDMLKPETAVFVKYEFWPAYLKELKKRGITTYSMASIFREWQAFFRPLIGRPYRRLLSCFTTLLVQDEHSRELLGKYGISNTEVVGDPRFNRVLQIAEEPFEDPIIEQFTGGQERIIVAGSTWQQDEELLCRYIDSHPEVRLILVPHEIDAKHLHHIFCTFRGRFIRYTQATRENTDTCQTIVVDKMGLLSRLYRYATVAYIGGGFGVGIHNTLEAAAYAKAVVWGKRYTHFREAAGLIEAGGGFSIKNYNELESVLDTLLSAPLEAGKKARAYVESEQDAAQKIANLMLH